MEEVPIIEIENAIIIKEKTIFQIISHSKLFRWMMRFFVVLEIFFIIYSTNYQVNNGRTSIYFKFIRVFFFTVFSIEFFIKLMAKKKKRKYFKSLKHCVDFFLIFTSAYQIIFVKYTELLPLVEVFPTIRIVRLFYLNKKLKTMFRAVLSVTWIAFPSILIFSSFILIFSFMGNYLYSESNLFNSLSESFVTVIDVMTKDSWPSTLTKLQKKYYGTRWFFIVIVIVLGTILSSLVIAQVTDEVASSAQKLEAKSKKKQIKKVNKLLKKFKKKSSIFNIEQIATYQKKEIEEMSEEELRNLPPPLPKRSMINNLNFIKATKIVLQHNINDIERQLELQSAIISRLKQISGEK